MNRGEVKTKLLAEAEAAIDALLEKAETKKPMKMREIVGLVLESRRQIETAMVATLSQATTEQKPAAPVCEHCGRPMHYKGKRRREIVTQAGETRLERDYYYCARCQAGRFPLG